MIKRARILISPHRLRKSGVLACQRPSIALTRAMLSRYNTAPEKIALLAESLSCCVSLPILWHYGRIHTNAPTPRTGKPRFLQQQPNLEILNLLQFVLADYGKKDDFFFVQIGAFDGVTADPIYELVRCQDWRGVLVEPQVEACERLQENYAGQDGLQFFNVAICDHDGEIKLFTRPDGMVQAASLECHLMKTPGRCPLRCRMDAGDAVGEGSCTLTDRPVADRRRGDGLPDHPFDRFSENQAGYHPLRAHGPPRAGSGCLPRTAGRSWLPLLVGRQRHNGYLGRSPLVSAG